MTQASQSLDAIAANAGDSDMSTGGAGGAAVSLAGRYARALFDLAQESQSPEATLEAVTASLDKVVTALAEVDGLRESFASPRLSRKQAAQLTAALAESLALDELTSKFLGVLATNRRLSALESIIEAFQHLCTAARKQISATITSAYPLQDKQLDSLSTRLAAQTGKSPQIVQRLDPEILGGLIIDIGSYRIDGSIRTRLHNITQAMKG